MAERDPLIALWPRALLREIDTVRVEMQRPAVFGPAPISGSPQLVTSPGGAWRISYVGVQAHRGNVHVLRALLARHTGRAQAIYVSPYDYLNGPLARVQATNPITSTYSDGTRFSDGVYWETSIYDCTLAADADEGDTEITIANSVTAPLKAGDYFELPGRLHIIEELDGSVARIWPRLRTSYSSDEKIEIADPRMVAYIDMDNSQGLNLQYGHWGSLTISFLEAPW